MISDTAAPIEIPRAAGRPLRIAGIIHDHEYFCDLVEPHLGHGVEYVGTVGRDERAGVLGDATALLHPIVFAEPFGLSVIEALACGTPVIATRRGAMAELIRPEVNGFLVDDTDEAVEVLRRIDTIDRYSCRLDAELRFSAIRMAADYVRVYEALIARRDS